MWQQSWKCHAYAISASQHDFEVQTTWISYNQWCSLKPTKMILTLVILVLIWQALVLILLCWSWFSYSGLASYTELFLIAYWMLKDTVRLKLCETLWNFNVNTSPYTRHYTWTFQNCSSLGPGLAGFGLGKVLLCWSWFWFDDFGLVYIIESIQAEEWTNKFCCTINTMMFNKSEL